MIKPLLSDINMMMSSFCLKAMAIQSFKVGKRIIEFYTINSKDEKVHVYKEKLAKRSHESDMKPLCEKHNNGKQQKRKKILHKDDNIKIRFSLCEQMKGYARIGHREKVAAW